MISDKDMIELSTLHAYAYYQKNEIFNVNGNTYYVVDIYNEKNGMNYGTDAMLVKNNSEEYALIYTGSDKKNDFVNDWLLNNGGNFLGINPPQYREGLKLFNQLSKSYNISRIGGVSLGGGISTYVGIHEENISVVSVNPSPQVFMIDKNYANITTVIDENDILFNLSSLIGRRNNYTKTIKFFNRGNEFVKNIKLNHIGYNKNLNLDDSIPFDLLTGNFTSNYIDIDVDDIELVNKNFTTYVNNQNNELNMNVIPELKNNILSYRDNISYQSIINSIIEQIYLYMVKSLPTLNSYFEFSYFFDEIKQLANNQCYVVFDKLLDTIVTELKLDSISKQIYIDSNNGVDNIAEINKFIENMILSCNKLVNNISLRDNSLNSEALPCLEMANLINNSNSRKLTYFKLVEYAKDIIYSHLKNIIVNKFKIIDAKIDAVVYTMRKIVGFTSDVVEIVSKEMSQKIAIVEQILKELYAFDIGDAVYNIFIISINEIISIVLPKDIDKKINSFRYLGQNFNNSSIIYYNYVRYLESFTSNGIEQITCNFSEFDHSFEIYRSYLHNTYN